MAFVNERNEDLNWHTIDRERNITLKKIRGGMPQMPYEFNLNIDGVEVNFDAYLRMRELVNGMDHVEWRVVEIHASPQLKLDRSQLHALIAEALDGYGSMASRKYVESLTVTFAHYL